MRVPILARQPNALVRGPHNSSDSCTAEFETKARALIYEFDEFQFEPGNARLSRRGVLLHAEPKAMQVLEVLLDGNGSLVDRDTLLNLVWGRIIVTPGTLTRLIAELRRLLGDDPLRPRFIETVHTKGYRWIAPVSSAQTRHEPLRAAGTKHRAHRPRRRSDTDCRSSLQRHVCSRWPAPAAPARLKWRWNWPASRKSTAAFGGMD